MYRIQLHNSTYDGLYQYYINTAMKLVQKTNKKPIVWNDVYKSFGTQLNKSVIVQVCKTLLTIFFALSNLPFQKAYPISN